MWGIYPAKFICKPTNDAYHLFPPGFISEVVYSKSRAPWHIARKETRDLGTCSQKKVSISVLKLRTAISAHAPCQVNVSWVLVGVEKRLIWTWCGSTLHGNVEDHFFLWPIRISGTVAKYFFWAHELEDQRLKYFPTNLKFLCMSCEAFWLLGGVRHANVNAADGDWQPSR